MMTLASVDAVCLHRFLVDLVRRGMCFLTFQKLSVYLEYYTEKDSLSFGI